MRKRRVWPMLALVLGLAWASAAPAQQPQGLGKISHILVIYLENRSFDNLFGEFPGANGVDMAGERAIQTDRSGKPYETLPPSVGPFNVPDNPPPLRAVETLGGLPNRPFRIDGIMPGVTAETYTRDLIHAFYTGRAQIDGGRMDRFAALSNAAALTMGHYGRAAMEGSNLWRLARDYTLMDNFFQGAHGGSFLNHIWLVCGCTPVWPNPPDGQRSELAPDGAPTKEARVTTKDDGDFAVNTTQSVFLNNGQQGANLLPPQTAPTIGDRLTEKGIDWAWYSGAWDLAIKPNRTAAEEEELAKVYRFQWHHQPFAYFARFDPGTPQGIEERRRHLRGAPALERDIVAGTLPPVAFYKPAGIFNQHPGYAGLVAGDQHVGRLVELMQASRYRDSFAIVITYDEFGGFWDHVPPPAGPEAGARADRWGPGPRIPAILVSPYARRGFVDSTPYDTTSILRLIQDRFSLEPLPSPRVNAVANLTNAFQF
jgi:phospholipase C